MAKIPDESNTDGRLDWQVSRTFLKFWDILILLIFGFIILLVGIRIVIGTISRISSNQMSFMLYEESSEEPSEAPPILETAVSLHPDSTQTPLATPEPEYGEVTDRTIDTINKKLGEVELSIPRLISPKSSNIISLSIYRPEKLASADPTTFLIVEIENDDFRTVSSLHGTLFTENRTILIDDRMKVELVAPAFEIKPQFPDIQEIDVNNAEKPAHWAWSIIAPETEGVHILNFKIFIDEESDTPSWFGAYQVEVMEPVPIPSETPMPSSILTDLRETNMSGIIDSIKFFLDLLAITSTIVGGVFALVRPYIKRRVDLAEFNKSSSKIQ